MMDSGLTRRDVLAGTAAGLVSAPTLARAASGAPALPVLPDVAAPSAPTHTVTLLVNGQTRQLEIDPRVSLLDMLREQVGLTGTKKGCDRGSCGACTVHIDGERVVSCLTLAARCEGKAVTTIEGLAQNGELHAMQAAFLHHDAFQCGYCTPGQIMSAVALIEEGHAGSDHEIREHMSGNICRCGAYPHIVAAIRDVAGQGV